MNDVSWPISAHSEGSPLAILTARRAAEVVALPHAARRPNRGVAEISRRVRGVCSMISDSCRDRAAATRSGAAARVQVRPLSPINPSAARNIDGRTLVEAAAAGSGSRRPAFTRACPSTTIGARVQGAATILAPSFVRRRACRMNGDTVARSNSEEPDFFAPYKVRASRI